jgi:hypothetical protein
MPTSTARSVRSSSKSVSDSPNSLHRNPQFAQSLCDTWGVGRSFEELVAEANDAPVRGWNFAWLEGRASEERPGWHYSELVAERMATASTMLDLETGGGEMLSHPGRSVRSFSQSISSSAEVRSL